MSKAKQAKLERNAKLVHQIIEATKPLIITEGYENITVREICEKAAITTGMFYRHFGSKDDLLTYCYMLDLEQYLTKAKVDYANLPLPEQLTMLLSNTFQINQQFGPASVYMFINRNTTSTSGSFKMRYMLKDCVVEMIDHAVKNGYQLYTNRSTDEIFNDISVILKGLTSDWYMVHQKDIVVQAHDIFGRLLPYIL